MSTSTSTSSKPSHSKDRDKDKALALSTVHSFHASFHTPPPFPPSITQKYTLPHGIITVPLPPAMGGLTTESFATMFARVSDVLTARYAGGMQSFEHVLVEPPEAEVWVSDSAAVAAVWLGWRAIIDGVDFARSVHVCSLLRVRGADDEDGDGTGTGSENPWRIASTVDMTHLPPSTPLPAISTGPVSEIIAPFTALLSAIKARNWAAIPALLLPGGGMTVSHGTTEAVTLLWPAWIAKLQRDAESGAVPPEKKLVDCEARRCDDLAFVWAPFVVFADDGRELGQRGVFVVSFRLEGGRWVVCGFLESFDS